MDDRPSQPRLARAVNPAQSQDQDRYEPLRLILQCDNGVHVPLVIMPGSDSAGVVGREKILVPDHSCGFGVVSFPRPHCASTVRRASSTSMADWPLWSCETGPGASSAGQRVDMAKASLRSCDSDSASTSHTHHAAGSVVDKDGKVMAQAIVANNNPSVAGKHGCRPTPSTLYPDVEKKKYCTYWIRTGECDYTQQGCRYKHEVPDLETLNRIGFRDFPLWWKRRLFKRNTERHNDALKRILAQLTDSEDSSSDSGADSEKSLPIAATAAAIVGTPKSQGVVLVKPGDAPEPTPEALNLIDLELVNHGSSAQRLAPVGSVIRSGQFVPYNAPRPVTSSSSSETLHPLPPSHVGSLTMPLPTVPHPTPVTSPEPKPAAPRKGKARSKDVPASAATALALPSLIDQQRGTAKTGASADGKNINLREQIETLQHHQREIEILAAGVSDTPSIPANVTDIGMPSDTSNTAKRKTRKSRRSKRSTKARALLSHPGAAAHTMQTAKASQGD